MSLLDDLQTSAVDSKTPITDLLRQCKVLAARLKHKDFGDWVSHELNGYGDDTPVPAYRLLVLTHSVGHFVGSFGRQAKNVPIPLSNLPTDLREALERPLEFRQAISVLVELGSTREQLRWPWPSDITAYIARHHPIYEDMVLIDARRPFNASTINGMVDTVRTRVLDFVLAIQEENPKAGDASATATPPVPLGKVTNIYKTTISGGLAVVGVSGGTASIGDHNTAVGRQLNGPHGHDEKLTALLAKLREHAKRAPREEKRKALAQVKKVETQLAKPKPDLGRIKEYLALFQTIVTVATPVVKATMEYLPLILK